MKSRNKKVSPLSSTAGKEQGKHKWHLWKSFLDVSEKVSERNFWVSCSLQQFTAQRFPEPEVISMCITMPKEFPFYELVALPLELHTNI